MAHAVKNICQGGQAEGGYFTDLPSDMGVAKFYIICVGSSSVVATAWAKHSSSYVSMVHLAVDGDVMSFLSYDPSEDGSKTSPGRTPSPELKVSIEALGHGEMIGTYRTSRLTRPLAIEVKRSMRFPNVFSNSSANYNSVKGQYILQNPEQLKGIVAPPVYILIDIVAGMQRIVLSDKNNSYALFSGLRATESDNMNDIFMANSGIDDATYGKSFISHVRGHMMNVDEIEFWYINTQTGVVGPFRAKRDAGDDAMSTVQKPVRKRGQVTTKNDSNRQPSPTEEPGW
jgi:hypothetical protein